MGQQPAVESYPEVVQADHVYQQPYNVADPYGQKPQHSAPEAWGQLEVGVPPAPSPVHYSTTPTPVQYSTTPTPVQYSTTPAPQYSTTPAPVQYNTAQNNVVEGDTGEKTPGAICGVKRKTFLILVAVLALAIILAAVGGGVGATLASKNKTPAAAAAAATTAANAFGNDGQPTMSATGDISVPTSTPTSTAVPTEGGLEAQGQAVRTGLTATRFQAESDKWTPLGYQLTSVSGYSFGITDVYAAVWELKVGPAIAAERNLNSTQYQTDLDAMGTKGYYPILVDAWTINGADRYGAIWVDSEGNSIPAWRTKFSLTKAQFQTDHDGFVGQGYCITCLSGYALGTEARYTALWNECPGAAANSTVLKYAVLPGQLQAQLNDMTKLGYRVSYVNGYALSNQAYYDLIYTLGSETAWFMMYGMNATRAQTKLDELSAQNYKVTVLSGYTINNNFLYSIIWDQ